MEVPLDGAHGAAQGIGQGLHFGPAQAALVVGVVGEGTICRDRLGGDSGEDEGLYLRDTRKLGLLRHQPPPIFGAAVRFDDKIHQSGGLPGKRKRSAAFFYALFTGAYFTYTGSLALAPPSRLGSLSGSALFAGSEHWRRKGGCGFLRGGAGTASARGTREISFPAPLFTCNQRC